MRLAQASGKVPVSWLFPRSIQLICIEICVWHTEYRTAVQQSVKPNMSTQLLQLLGIAVCYGPKCEGQ